MEVILMAEKFTYHPILKWKEGERSALKQITTPNQSFIPVFEFVEDQSSIDPAEFFKKTLTCYNGAFYFDTIRIDDTEKNLLKALLNYAINHSISAYPMLYPEDIDTGLVTWVSQKVECFGFNIPIPESSTPNDQIISKLVTLSKPQKINLFLDAGNILTDRDANLITFACKDFINKEETKLTDFYKITFTACSIPKELSDVESGGTEYFIRYNIAVFSRLIKEYKNKPIIKKLSYADYGPVGASYIKFDPKKMRVLPKIKYTTFEYYIVLKGKKSWATSTMTKGYKELAQEVVNSEYYFGKDFSYGDNEIYKKANDPNAGIGNNCQWVGYNTNHHIAVLVAQLSTLGDA